MNFRRPYIFALVTDEFYAQTLKFRDGHGELADWRTLQNSPNNDQSSWFGKSSVDMEEWLLLRSLRGSMVTT